jgi:hypothetical protein
MRARHAALLLTACFALGAGGLPGSLGKMTSGATDLLKQVFGH